MWTQPLSRVSVFSDEFHRYWVNSNGTVRKRPTPAQLRRQGWEDAYKRPAVADAGRLLAEALLVIALTAACIALVGYRAANEAFMEDRPKNDGVDDEALPVSRDGVAPDAAPVGRDGKPLYGTTAAPPDPGAET